MPRAPSMPPSCLGVAPLVEPERAAAALTRPFVTVKLPLRAPPGNAHSLRRRPSPGRSAEFRSAFLIARAPHDGCEDLTSPATPATCGAAIEVPLKVL